MMSQKNLFAQNQNDLDSSILDQTRELILPFSNSASSCVSFLTVAQRLELTEISRNLVNQHRPQMNRYSCSSASLSMVLNAARGRRFKISSESRITEQHLVNRIGIENWREKLSSYGHEGEHGVHLESFSRIVKTALELYGFRQASTEIVYMSESLEQSTRDVESALNRLSKQVYMIANFDQHLFIADSHAGHFSPVGSYNPATQEVLILDPDREILGPYWVPLKTFTQGMSTQEYFSGKNRGFVLIDLGSH